MNGNDHIVAEDVDNLKSGEVGQVKAATSLELAELVQLLRHLEVIGCQNLKREGTVFFFTCLVPPIALEVFFLYLVIKMEMKNEGKIRVVLK